MRIREAVFEHKAMCRGSPALLGGYILAGCQLLGRDSVVMFETSGSGIRWEHRPRPTPDELRHQIIDSLRVPRYKVSCPTDWPLPRGRLHNDPASSCWVRHTKDQHIVDRSPHGDDADLRTHAMIAADIDDSHVRLSDHTK
jgi:hypothetical protein